MKLTSLAIKTDLIFVRFNGEIIDKTSYVVARTPTNPNFHWGNFLIFPGPPAEGDFTRWLATFKDEFTHLPKIDHVTLTWNSSTTSAFVKDFTDHGFSFESNEVLATSSVTKPSKFHSKLLVRPLVSDVDWELATTNQLAVKKTSYDSASYEIFKRKQMANYRRMSEGDHGHWFGAFLGDQLVGDLGVYRDGSIGRFQSVVTHPEFQRQGVCGTLVYAAAVYALKTWRLETLVMVADAGYHAARIYESVGFKVVELNYALSRVGPLEGNA